MELYEASQYGLLERIPVLLTSVSVNATNSVSTRYNLLPSNVLCSYHSLYEQSTKHIPEKMQAYIGYKCRYTPEALKVHALNLALPRLDKSSDLAEICKWVLHVAGQLF